MTAELVYPKLSYEIVGIVFEVYNKLGYGYQEKYYQRAIAEELKRKGYTFKRELTIPIKYNDKIIGRYYIDFVIDNKIALELKVARGFYPKDWKQLAAYLKASKLQLGILILITSSGVKYRRIAN